MNHKSALGPCAASSPLKNGRLDFALFGSAASGKAEPRSAARKAASAVSGLTFLAEPKMALSRYGHFSGGLLARRQAGRRRSRRGTERPKGAFGAVHSALVTKRPMCSFDGKDTF